MNLVEMIHRERAENFKKNSATTIWKKVLNLPEEEANDLCKRNIYNNAAKYAMEGTDFVQNLTVLEDGSCYAEKCIRISIEYLSADELTGTIYQRNCREVQKEADWDCPSRKNIDRKCKKGRF